jgi:hypothetical protein
MAPFVALGMRSQENVPENGAPTVGFPSRHFSKTAVGFGKVILVKYTVTTLQQTPYPHDLAPVVFYLFPRLK